MSQAGITKADKIDFLELHGWIRLVRDYGGKLFWLDPRDLETELPTLEAYDVAKAREDGGR